MKKLGRIVSKEKKKIVLKTDKLVKIGTEVYDSGERHIGTVIDYFGPVDGPYLLISTKKDADKMIGMEIYG